MIKKYIFKNAVITIIIVLLAISCFQPIYVAQGTEGYIKSVNHQIDGDEITIEVIVEDFMADGFLFSDEYKIRIFNIDNELLDEEPDFGWKNIDGESYTFTISSALDPTWDINNLKYQKYKIELWEENAGLQDEIWNEFTIEKKVLFVLASFPDDSFSADHDLDYYKNNFLPVFNQYWEDVSYGKLKISENSKIIDIGSVTLDHSIYGANTIGPLYVEELLWMTFVLDVEARALLQGVVAESYDMEIIIHAGDSEQDSYDDSDLTTAALSGWIPPVAIVAENDILRPGIQNDVYTAAHEFGHLLGLSDHYDVKLSNHPSYGGQYCLMSYQWEGATPSAVDRNELGWCELIDITFPLTIEIDASCIFDNGINIGSNKVYRIDIPGDVDYYIEAKEQNKYDPYLNENGICIWYHDFSIPSFPFSWINGDIIENYRRTILLTVDNNVYPWDFDTYSDSAWELYGDDLAPNLFNENILNEPGEYIIDTENGIVFYLKSKNPSEHKYTLEIFEYEPLTRTYTLDSDFDEGILIGLEHDSIHNQLQLSDKSSTYPALWVANAGEDSLSKWDTENNVELARYHTWFGSLGNHGSWSGPAPSRTCVDSDGNCYVANRHFDTYKPDVIKVYTDTWVDRNGNGVLDTSYDANDNGVIEESEMLPMIDSNYNGRIDAEEITDERIAWATQVNGGGVGRSLAIDLDGNIWLGCFDSYRYYKLDSDDGSIIGGPYYVYGHTPYGALVDKYGYLWGASLSSNILKLNTNNPAEYEIYYVPNTYGIALGYDSQDNTLVYCGYNSPYVVFNSYTETYSYPAESWDSSLGVAVDSDGNIAVGSYYDGDVAKYAQDGTIIWAVTGQINSEVRGIVFDSDDNIWAIHRDTSKLCKYNGENGAYMGVYNAGLYPYTYTDATGLGYQGSIGVGIWEVVFNSGTSNAEWGVISWNSYTPPDTSLWVEVRSSNDGLSWSSWETAVNGINLGSTPDGRYLKIRTTMKIIFGEISPVLFDITVATGGIPIQSEQPQLKAPWLGIQRITQGNNAPPYPPYSHYDHGTWDNTYAIDVALPIGSDVRAPADGVISWYDDDPGGSGGIELAIDHIGPTGKTFTTVYLHLSEIIVKSGTVEQGDLVARSGDTGYVTGPHLHYHMWNGIGSRDSHTTPIERSVMKKYGNVDFCEYDARDHELDNNKIEGQFFESNILSLEEMEWIEAQIKSPVELRVIDSEMRISGVIDGDEIVEIPNSVYINETVMIFSTDDTFAYSIVGIDNGTYNLKITKNSPTGDVVFNAFDISTKIGANHLYAIDWDALSNGEEGVTIDIDKDGDGIFERTITSDGELTIDEFILQTEITIDIDPDTLNINSSGKWITCYIELPEDYNVSNINLSTILLNDIVSIETKPINIGDYDNDTLPDLMVKFDRKDVIEILEIGERIEMIISGELIDGTKFGGLDYIRVIEN